jgi:hypothetical protein
VEITTRADDMACVSAGQGEMLVFVGRGWYTFGVVELGFGENEGSQVRCKGRG